MGIACATEGLRSNPEDQLLRNNLAFAYARSGDFAEAERVFRKVRLPLQPTYPLAVYQATCGLIAYIRGDYEAGRQHYREATKSPDPQTRALAAVSYFETEWTFFPSQRAEIARELARMLPRVTDPATRAVAKRLIDSSARGAPNVSDLRFSGDRDSAIEFEAGIVGLPLLTGPHD